MVTCPVCKKEKPFLPLYTPGTSFKQMMLGQWVCENCKSVINGKGKAVKENKEGLKEYEDRLYKEEYLKEKARLQAQKEHKKK